MAKPDEFAAKKVRIAYFWDTHKCEIEEALLGEPCYRLKILFDVASQFEQFGGLLKRSGADETLKILSDRALERLLDAILYEISCVGGD